MKYGNKMFKLFVPEWSDLSTSGQNNFRWPLEKDGEWGIEKV
jgi:hypothetical protein